MDKRMFFLQPKGLYFCAANLILDLGRISFYPVYSIQILESCAGEMPEWSIGAVSKTVDPLAGPRVRIPVSPQTNSKTR